ncbi:hypothetical protein H7U18_05945 [Klebsiella pneumoniae]|uniref:Uncharacterized protein n=1 Tax=Klebsiella pneumoniae TaxID=573 RepID=A0A923J6V4_KLEPN|nr:hypothetical protein [Klebsiella pneumoniae]
MVGHRQVAFCDRYPVSSEPQRQQRIDFCENPIYHIDLIYYLISIFDALYWLKNIPRLYRMETKAAAKSAGQGIRKQIKYCERSNIIRIGSFFVFPRR